MPVFINQPLFVIDQSWFIVEIWIICDFSVLKIKERLK